MMHIRTDQEIENSKRRFACGIGPELPAGDMWINEGEFGLYHMVDCPGCGPGRPLGTPISQISTVPGTPGYAEWIRISESWGMP